MSRPHTLSAGHRAARAAFCAVLLVYGALLAEPARQHRWGELACGLLVAVLLVRPYLWPELWPERDL